jgi:uncharacterized membrane protein YuzA (DUF378 family)
MHNKKVHMVAFLLVIVGGLNWLLVGAFNIDLVAMLLGAGSSAAKAVYILVGLAAVYEVVGHKGRCKECNA